MNRFLTFLNFDNEISLSVLIDFPKVKIVIVLRASKVWSQELRKKYLLAQFFIYKFTDCRNLFVIHLRGKLFAIITSALLWLSQPKILVLSFNSFFCFPEKVGLLILLISFFGSSYESRGQGEPQRTIYLCNRFFVSHELAVRVL